MRVGTSAAVHPDGTGCLDETLVGAPRWIEDRARRRDAGIAAAVVSKPKWQIALELVQRSCAEGVPLRWITADEFYGRAGEFRDGVVG
jgi:SRSO17 transposase